MALGWLMTHTPRPTLPDLAKALKRAKRQGLQAQAERLAKVIWLRKRKEKRRADRARLK